jgi:nucleoside 2-deoxyribosyltransferase
MKVYLSGPMTGLPDSNFPAFRRYAARLRAEGFEVISPAELHVGDGGPLTWEQYLRKDLRELLTCDAIALMPGWENSRGANLEAHVARALGMMTIRIEGRYT